MGGLRPPRASPSADPALRGTVVVLLIGRSDDEMDATARESGAVACLDEATSRRKICVAISRVAAHGATDGTPPDR